MNSLTEALGMSLPGSAAIPAPHRDRQQCAWETGRQIVEMVAADRKPSDIMTREAFLNAIRVNSAIGGSTNAPIHINAIARHLGVSLTISDWEEHGANVPLLVNLQPAGEYLGEDFHRAGGVPAVMGELLRNGQLEGSALTANGKSVSDNIAAARSANEDVIRPYGQPLSEHAGLTILSGNLFDNAVMKTSVISPQFRSRYLSDPASPNRFEGRAIVFDGPEDYHHRIDDPALGIDQNCILIMRGAGPVGYPGGAEVVNMRPPAALIQAGIDTLPCIGDGRQSGTSGSPSVLNASPEAAAGGGLGLVRTGDTICIDLNTRRVDVMLDDDEIERRRGEMSKELADLAPQSQTPWQEIQRNLVGQFGEGAVIESAVKYQRIAQTKGLPRDSH